jgi:hypothetical protein
VANGSSRSRVEADLTACIERAQESGREDLVARLEGARRLLDERDLPVVVAGEFKQGKSSLVNALVKSEVCPVDDDLVTAVPTIVRFGPEPAAFVHLTTDDGDDAPALPIPLESVPGYVRGDTGDDEDAGVRVRSVEVRLDRRVLRTGISFVDCPGVGGLESAEGSITLGVLNLAQALLFVTAADQELTRAEIVFMQAAQQRVPRVVCVVSKIDLHAEWRRIVALNEAHLEREGLDVPVLAVSSFLRLRAASRGDAGLDAESRFPTLFDYLRREVADGGDGERIDRVAAEVAFVTRMLRRSLQAESDVIARPEQGPEVLQELAKAEETAGQLRASGAPWQRVLGDGIQDLVEDVRHDLRDRLRTVLQEGEQVIDRSDPKDSWAEFETWIRRQVVAAAGATYEHLARQAVALADKVGRQFSQDADTPVALSITAPIAALERVQLAADFSSTTGGKSNVMLIAARGSYGGMLMFGMAGSLLSIPMAAPVVLLLGLGLGRKSVRDEMVRRHAQRQQQAKAALRQYVDKVSFIVDRECRVALRRTQRLLRDEFTARAESLHQSSSAAVSSAREAMALDEAARDARSRQVDQELAALGGQP